MFKKEISPGSKSKVKSSLQRAIRAQVLETYPLLAPYIDEVMPKKEQLDAMKIPDRVTLYLLSSTDSLSSSSSTAASMIPLFYQHMTDPILPHLRLVHRFPFAFPAIRIDRGAIRFLLSGATLMAPGLTSKGGRLPDGEVRENDGEPKHYGEDTSIPNDSTTEDAMDSEAPKQEQQRQQEEVEHEKEGYYGGRELEKGEPVVIWAEGKREPCAVGLLVQGTKEIKASKKGPAVEDAHYLGDGLWRLGAEE